MKYLSFLALLSTALGSTAQASSQPKPYFTDDEVNLAPIKVSAQQRLAPMKMHQRQPQTIQEQLNAAYHHQFQGNSQTQIHVYPTSVPQFFTYMDASKFNEPPTPESPHPYLALSGNISPQQNRQPMSIYEQLRHEQDMACDSMTAQKAQNQERRLAADQTALEWVEYLPDSTTQRIECERQQREYRWHDQTASSYAPTPKPSHTSKQPSNTKENTNTSATQQTKPSSAPLPKPIPVAPSTLNNASALSPFSLTLEELYALAPVSAQAKASRNINTNTHGDTQPLDIIPTAPIMIESPLTATSVTPLTKPHNYERRLFIDGS